MTDQQPASVERDPAFEDPLAPSSIKTFLQRRWRGRVPLATIFWRDMMLVGTLLNVAGFLWARMAITGSMADLVWLANVVLVPINLFLFFSVWRSTDQPGVESPHLSRIGACLWFLAMTAKWAV
jgi:hypothetical protein